ncbi:hypothetical protein NECAME_10604 [Necator americanus]|uniref:Uncharacterized protein n=1 Tax=Necator americanus TaxID=51031 RepID=W2TAQ6_NECAM|nr:hypothetical protein NECAME_10604 [Necator americanus]ETN78097.1 hypothetical protein NECAME_10604 [Necator americanus]
MSVNHFRAIRDLETGQPQEHRRGIRARGWDHGYAAPRLARHAFRNRPGLPQLIKQFLRFRSLIRSILQ